MEHTCTATQTSQITSIHQVDARCLLPYTQLSYLSGLNMLEHAYNVAQTGHAIQILRIQLTLHQLDARYLQYHTTWSNILESAGIHLVRPLQNV